MTPTWRFLADLGERAGRSFIQGFLGLWLANPAKPIDFDTLFTVANLKAGVVMAVLAVGMALLGKPIGSPDTGSVLPPPAQPAELPADAPTPESPDGVLTAAVYSNRLGAWSTAYLHPEAASGGGTFTLTGEQRDGLPVACYQPDRTGTHNPLGPVEMTARGLRPAIPTPEVAA